ncbi:acyltransferase [Candidatus Pelagibacter sp.]|jgi:acetyltransferase-like isoleucine patch superfamily enzyme|nr:acyltransferase [Candidatus Pelagibacter sp.]
MNKILKNIFSEIISFGIFFITFCPGYSGKYIRKIVYKKRFKSLGNKFFSEIGLVVTCPKNISLGSNCSIKRFSSLNACENSKIEIGDNMSVNYNVNINSCNGGHIKIGDNVLIASNVIIRAADHVINNKNKLIRDSGHEGGQIVIGNNVWIGSNCVILKDVNIGDGAIIGAGTIVTRNIEMNEVVVGNKQTKIKNRLE